MCQRDLDRITFISITLNSSFANNNDAYPTYEFINNYWNCFEKRNINTFNIGICYSSVILYQASYIACFLSVS